MISGKLIEDDLLWLKTRYEGQKSDRTTVQEIWEDIERYVIPYRGMFFKEETNEHTIDWFKRQIFDDTAVEAASTLSASINGSLTSFVSEWFSLRFRQKELNEDNEVAKWLIDVTKIAYHALEESDFSLEIAETYTDLVGFGTSILIEEEMSKSGTYDGLDFQSVPIKHGFFETDVHGKVLYFYRRHLWTPLQIIDKFGVENVPDDIKDLNDKTGPQEKVEVCFCIFPREGYKDVDISAKIAADKRPYGSVYFLAKDGQQCGKEGGYYEMPAYVPKWRKTNDSQWGNSPAMLVLSDIKTLNDLVELTLSQLAKVVDPPSFTTERGLLSDLDLEPAGLTVVRSKEDFWQYQSTARFEPGELRIGALQESIRRAFMVDQLELKESPAMSATEANIRYELMQRLLGPTLGRLKSDLFDPLISRTINILHRAGALPEKPQLIADLQGEFDVEYVGPLAKAQRAQTALAMQNWAGQIGETATLLGNVDPEAATQLLAVGDWDAFASELADIMGVPATVMTDKKVRASDKRKRKAQSEEASKVAEVGAKGESMKALGDGAQSMNESGATPEDMVQ